MAYVGTPLDTTNAFQSLAGKRFNGDASTTAFSLDSAPNSTLDIEVFIENVRQDPNSAYTVSGTTLTFTSAPPSGTNNIYVVHQAKAVGTIDPAVGSTLDLNGAAELVLDADADTTIAADTDDQIDFKVGGTDQIKLVDGALVPVTDNDIDLGTASLEFKNAYIDGTLEADAITIGGTALTAGTSKIVWKATTTATLALDNQGDVGFTDVDLTSVTSSDAAGVILSASMRNNTANEYAQLEFRKNGDTPDYPAKMTTDDSFGANVNHFGTILVGCDTGQIIEYKIDTESSSSVSVTMSVLGYWE